MPEKIVTLAELLESMLGSKERAKDVMDSLSPYEAEDRFYHDTEHIREVLAQVFMGSMDLPDNQRTALALAAVWHDVVYDSRAPKGQNELMSVGYALGIGEWIGVEPYVLNMVKRLILLTIDHKTDESDHLGQLLIDADLSRFAADWPDFVKHNEDIRAEYDWVSDEDWLAGRAAVLEKYLWRTPFYYLAHERTSQRAQLNLVRAISELKHASD